MTHKEENIVNIAMRAAELLKDGKIQCDDISGHAGLTEQIIFLSELFEKQYAGVDFNAGNKDYWEEVDSFAEIQLMALYGLDNPDLYNIPQYPVKVFAVAGPVRNEIYSGNWDECTNFCVEHDWAYMDDNDFEWSLEIQDEREASFPEHYYDAVEHYANQLGCEVECEYIREHADQLVYCFLNDVDYSDFVSWTRYEYLLDENLTFEEGTALINGFETDPLDISEDAHVAINELRVFLNGFRAGNSQRPSLDTMIQSAFAQHSEEPVGPRNLSEINRNAPSFKIDGKEFSL